MLWYTLFSFNSRTNASAENTAKGQNVRQNTGCTLPAKRKSSATANDSMTMRASTSIAAPRLKAGGERWKALCNLSTGPKSFSPILCKSHIIVHSNFYGRGEPVSKGSRVRELKCREGGRRQERALT